VNNEVVIRVENLYKEYCLGTISHGTLRQDLQSWWARMRGKEDPNSLISTVRPSSSNDSRNPHFLALKDVSFEVKRGDVLGIIGSNGAGKSTLLKILSEVNSPTKGTVKIKGRVASLLEVGTGFHSELTGRENIFLNGAILGMKKAEINMKFDEIVAFAEVGKFIDTPVKRYSSGMYVRLAFAVAAHLESEILIVDEVLAVGDTSFQKKCLGKMGEVSKDGRTVLFVSHNIAAIKTLCSTGIVLNKGQMIFHGGVEEAVDQYMGPNKLDKNEISWDDIAGAENENIRLKSIAINPLQGSIIDIDSGIEITTVFYNKIGGRSLDFTLRMFTIDGVCLFETGIILSRDGDAKTGYFSTKVEIPPHLLNAGIYKINLVFGESQMYLLYAVEDIISFEVEHTTTGRGNNISRAPGVIRPLLNWSYKFSLQ
jgi:lipopolysaccharide transport system ATP-binding protein